MKLTAGKILMPIVFMMGVPWNECEIVSGLVGVKSVVNEFFAYQKLSDLIRKGSVICT